jgi:integration host factor subunit beta
MNKSELILNIASRFPQLTHTDTALSVQTILDGMACQLGKSKRIEIRGFGSFNINARPARIGRNPKTGEKVNVAAKHVPHFKPGLELKNKIKESS